MSKQSRQLRQLKYDTRLIEFNMNNGDLSQSELDTHLNGLSDCEGSSRTLDIFNKSASATTEAETVTESEAAPVSTEPTNTDGGNSGGSFF